MRAFSLTQPWASAVALGIKQWETRSWPTRFRGEVAIHASKAFPRWAREFADLESCTHPELDELPLGYIVAVCQLTECRQTETLAPTLSEQELRWGDYSPGRYAFKLESVRLLEEPVFHRGALSFWSVAWDETNQILRQLKRKGS
jgi:hypothetical protein